MSDKAAGPVMSLACCPQCRPAMGFMRALAEDFRQAGGTVRCQRCNLPARAAAPAETVHPAVNGAPARWWPFGPPGPLPAGAS